MQRDKILITLLIRNYDFLCSYMVARSVSIPKIYGNLPQIKQSEYGITSEYNNLCKTYIFIMANCNLSGII